MDKYGISMNQPEFKPSTLHGKKLYSVVSFFAGCGGLDLGFMGGIKYKDEHLLSQPFTIVSAYDSDEKCVTTYKLNIGNHVEIKDLEHVNPREIPKADVLIGGFPCQDFSICGPRVGLVSKRGRLYRALVKYMRYHKPTIVVAENVPHLARMRQGLVLDVIIKDMEDAGYRFEQWSLFGPDYGIPQNRTRLFFIGVRQDIEGMPTKPERTHVGNHRSIDWAIGDLETIDGEQIPNHNQYFKATRAKNGGGQGDETCIAGQPSYTIRANSHSRIQFHYSLSRRLTVRECARLQTFPDTFIFPFSTTMNMKQIGNAVPPLLAYHVSDSIAKFLDKLP